MKGSESSSNGLNFPVCRLSICSMPLRHLGKVIRVQTGKGGSTTSVNHPLLALGLRNISYLLSWQWNCFCLSNLYVVPAIGVSIWTRSHCFCRGYSSSADAHTRALTPSAASMASRASKNSSMLLGRISNEQRS